MSAAKRSVRIAVLVEGASEVVFKRALIAFLQTRLPGNMPKLDFMPYNGRIPTDDVLKRHVTNLEEE
ncbi:MAG: hypothetical protein LBU39_02530 [Desulfobulbaceae bacterium]|nr:hypothetical protein [Desulfobulbaceae bacterium]